MDDGMILIPVQLERYQIVTSMISFHDMFCFIKEIKPIELGCVIFLEVYLPVF